MKIMGQDILIVEDEPIIGLVLEDYLRERGANTLLAETLEAACAALAATSFDLAILDVNIHGRTSYDLAQKLLERGTSVLFATGYGNAMHPAELADVPTISKPYQLRALETALAELVVAGG